jgi:excisionase family DNA binding protein
MAAQPGPPQLTRLYLRPDEAAKVIGVSRRTLSAWQAARVISYRRVGRTVLFSVPDIQRALDKFTVAAIGEPRQRKTIETNTINSGAIQRKRRMIRVTSGEAA